MSRAVPSDLRARFGRRLREWTPWPMRSETWVSSSLLAPTSRSSLLPLNRWRCPVLVDWRGLSPRARRHNTGWWWFYSFRMAPWRGLYTSRCNTGWWAWRFLIPTWLRINFTCWRHGRRSIWLRGSRWGWRQMIFGSKKTRWGFMGSTYWTTRRQGSGSPLNFWPLPRMGRCRSRTFCWGNVGLGGDLIGYRSTPNPRSTTSRDRCGCRSRRSRSSRPGHRACREGRSLLSDLSFFPSPRSGVLSPRRKAALWWMVRSCRWTRHNLRRRKWWCRDYRGEAEAV